MLNEDELRDAILLVFANKQDLPVSILKLLILYLYAMTNLRLSECHERRRDYRQVGSSQLETKNLGM
jgi:hypothetical protein